jgi:hypothetical protein
MPNYKDGKIYKIVCNLTDECYIGSTTEPTLARRLSGHVGSYKSWKAGKSKKVRSYDIIDRGDYKIYLIESYPCNSKDELISREGEIIRQNRMSCECINYSTPGRTKKQWNEENIEKLRRQGKEYTEINKEKIKEQKSTKLKCLCGSSICAGNKAKHERTNKHQDYLKSIQ